MRTAEIITVRPEQDVDTKQRLPYFVGISGATAGSTGLSLNLVVIPPGACAEPHLHLGFETAIYLLQGEVETRYGEDLSRTVVNRPGDFVYIPADLPHPRRPAASGDQLQRDRTGDHHRRAQRRRRAGARRALSLAPGTGRELAAKPPRPTSGHIEDQIVAPGLGTGAGRPLARQAILYLLTVNLEGRACPPTPGRIMPS